jgi:LuxR family maltose regulon positive regulatory protein
MEHDVDSGSRAFEPILRTKLHRPQLGADLVNRDRLIEAMDRADEVPLTLVSAPAGYGKSVLVAQWAEQLDCPTAWLSLDASDSDLRTFLLYFIAAVDSVSPGSCEATRELLAAGPLAAVPALAGYLLNDLDALEAPCAIVLDDFHRIDPLSPVQDLMLQMLEHPPRRFRFVLPTRQDPPFDLVSLRANHRVNEVRLRDLRFTAQETREFLSETAHLSLSDEVLTQLQHQVEGWAAGLRLLSFVLRQVDSSQTLVKKLPEHLPQAQDYLLREVLASQPAEVSGSLLASSILDRFCEGVIDAVCGRPDTDDQAGFTAAAFLEELHRSNLFTISLDARREWFRYHHLFRELLVAELERRRGPDHLAALHLRASRWFENQGLIDEAIRHALAAEETGRAIQLVARHRHEALDSDQWWVLESWLSLLPAGSVEQNAQLLMARAWILLNYHFRVEAVPPLLDEIESLLGDDPGDERVRGEVAASRGYVLWLMGNGAESLQHAEVALERIPLEHRDFRSNTELVFVLASQMVGRKAEGFRFLDDLLAHPDSLHEMHKTRLLAGRVFVHLTAGDLLAAEVANRRLSTAGESGGSRYVRAWTSYLQGLIHLQRGEWEAAVEFLERSVAQRFLHHRRVAVDSMIGLMLAQQALGRKDEAQVALGNLNGYVATFGDSSMERLAASAEARLAILQGNLEAARRWAEATGSPPEGAVVWWFEIPSITRCRAMLAAGPPGAVVKAEALLRECADVIEAQHNTCQLIRVLTLLAMAYDRQGKTGQALGTLERAVTLARKGDLVLPFVELGTPMVDLLGQVTGEREFTDRIDRLVTAFGLPTDRPDARKAEAVEQPTRGPEGRPAVAGRNLQGLTNRELDVLELLARRLQNKEIAAALGISHQTVHSHLKQIYDKLGVHGRRQAVERAETTRILQPPD